MTWQSNCAVCVKRKNCNTKKELEKFYPSHIAIGCADCIVEQPTNADRIRAMSDEELAPLFANDNCGYCHIHDFCYAKGCQIDCEDMWLDWLKNPAQPGEREDG